VNLKSAGGNRDMGILIIVGALIGVATLAIVFNWGAINDLMIDPLAKIIAIASVLVSCATFGVVCWVNIYRPRKSRELQQEPGTAYFLVPTQQGHLCEYASQDANEHILKEINLRPNSEIIVDFVVDIKTSISITEISIECQGEIEKKPYAIRYFNRFIEVGNEREISPGEGNNRHYIDKHKVYHARGDKTYPPARIAIAFVIKTREPGIYPVVLEFVGEEVLGSVGNLYITVEDTPTEMRCVDPKHEEMACAKDGILPPVSVPKSP
jgi:hypothetical protein